MDDRHFSPLERFQHPAFSPPSPKPSTSASASASGMHRTAGWIPSERFLRQATSAKGNLKAPMHVFFGARWCRFWSMLELSRSVKRLGWNWNPAPPPRSWKFGYTQPCSLHMPNGPPQGARGAGLLDATWARGVDVLWAFGQFGGACWAGTLCAAVDACFVHDP